MKVKLAINGFGRIGRIVFRETYNRDNVEVVAINDLLEVEHLAYLLKYDSVHGRFSGKVEVKDGKLYVNDKHIRVTAQKDPATLKWDEVGVDVVAECTGIFTTIETAQAHIKGGAKKVVISAPSADAPMFVMGNNCDVPLMATSYTAPVTANEETKLRLTSYWWTLALLPT